MLIGTPFSTALLTNGVLILLFGARTLRIFPLMLMVTLVNTGDPIINYSVPVTGNRPMDENRYHDDIAPLSSSPNSPAGALVNITSG